MANLDGLKPNLAGFYNELKQAVPEATITSGKRNKAIGTAGVASHHLKGGAMDIGANPKVGEFLGSARGQALLSKYGLGYMDETTKEALKKTGGTGAHYHIGEDSKLVAKARENAGGAQPQINTDFSQPTLNTQYAPVKLPDFSINSPASIFGDRKQADLPEIVQTPALRVFDNQQLTTDSGIDQVDAQNRFDNLEPIYDNTNYQTAYQGQQNINISPIEQSAGNTEQIRQYLTDLWDNTDISKEEYMNG